ncbi:N-acetylmuramic acid 6-phosphate etherase [Rhizobiaceae bacterium n13]|uniref:N-acetylmuramic acid 6-phosphate etherase n=1 Tax=Ferirhizobium litorale TaxID=2927786 RepID=A0AAE3QEF8_9HYPH|nr:N-acetylmuramic acid 6-phosphate etherase [Fererhizobium litorale]MDI7862308.1 N-acetylmuramic acid 6-phosphate etherase [Fererhizobium litorale]MDI7922418.1 N-acetylmuramic acid 6-phosphate etherase [Fererhizobium litorale]
MTTGQTEARHESGKGLDAMPPADILRILAAGQQAAAQAVDSAIPSIADASTIAADCLGKGGRLIYVGAGSSGLMAMADALELPGTYGISKEQVVILIAGGNASLSDLAGGYEDDTDLAREDMAAVSPVADDCVICVSASGSTPYVVAAAEIAKTCGASVVAIANNAGARLFADANISILIETPPEVIAGSTRMGAGTAQKIALNMFSTLVGILLGHVHDGHMVNLRADNEKLRIRASRIVSDIAGLDVAEANALLDRAAGSVKAAILLSAGTPDRREAEELLAASGQSLRRALAKAGKY